MNSPRTERKQPITISACLIVFTITSGHSGTSGVLRYTIGSHPEYPKFYTNFRINKP
jgi:hypothetical protein